MKKYIVLAILFLATSAYGQGWQEARMNVGVVGGGVTGGGGTPTWYYPTGITENNDDSVTTSGWQHHLYVYGNRIQVGASGTATAIAVKLTCDDTVDTVKIGIYNDSNTLLAQCSSASVVGTLWLQCSISQAVTNGTFYRVFFSTDDEFANVASRYVAGQTGWYGTCAFADAMCNPLTSVGSESSGYTARICVGGVC